MDTTAGRPRSINSNAYFLHVKYYLRPSVDRFRATQLRDGSSYSRLLKVLPVPVIAAVWLKLVYGSHQTITSVFAITISVRHLLLACAIILVWNVWLRMSLHEKRSAKIDLAAEVIRLTAASFACGLLPFVANLPRHLAERGILVGTLTGASMLVGAYGLLGFFLIGAILYPKFRRPHLALIVGTGRRAAELRARIQSHYSRFQIFGCLDDEYLGHNAALDNYLGSIDTLHSLLKTQPIDVVLIGLPIKSKYDDIQRVIEICETVGVESHYMRDIFSTSRANQQQHREEPGHFSVLSTVRQDPKYVFKRGFDILLGTLFLLLFSPIMLAAAAAVWLSGPGPIIFVQQRYGRNRQLFPMFKFRSMIVDAEQKQAALEGQNEAQGPAFKIKSDPRITRVGAFLRKTSIDELPQLFNVLRGEMSLVGPRPLPIRDVTRFEESWLLRRFSVRPGLTCLWQINGRSNTSFDQWVQQDLRYIDGWSLSLDFKILILTIPAVLRGIGAV